MTLKPLTQRQWPQLHQMMLAEGFPHTPQSFSKASCFLEDCLCFGIFDGNDTLEAAIVLGEVTKESAFVDAVCLKERRGRWLKPQLLRCFFKMVFEQMGLRYLWAEPHSKPAYQLLGKLGFVWVTGVEQHKNKPPCFALTQGCYQQSKFKRG